jgi:hypothetical protein
MLQNTPNNHLGSNGEEWMLWLRNHICNFGTPNSAFRPETQVSIASFYFPKVYEMLQITPNNHLGQME